MSFIEDAARETIDSALSGIRSPAAFLSALLRIAGDRLAEHADHDQAAAEHAKCSRMHHERARGRRG